VSVAVSGKPEGPFSFYGHVKHSDGTRYGYKKGDAYGFDPAVFMDDDNRVYLYTGFSPDKGGFRLILKMRGGEIDGGYGIELDSDMKTIKGKQFETVPGPIKARGTAYEGHGFFEASSMRKINGRYCFVYSSELSHELCYALSSSPSGPFTYGGTLVSIGDIGYKRNTTPKNYLGNTHGGMVEINGQWYIFYHRQTNKQKCARQGCAEKIYIKEDGSIDQVEVTSCGLNEGPLNGTGTYEARIACNLYGKDGAYAYVRIHHKEGGPYFTQTGEDRNDHPDQYIADMEDGSLAGFKYFSFNGENKISLRLKGTGTGLMHISTEENGIPFASVKVTPSTDWKDYSTAFTPLNGVHALFMKYEGEGAVDFDSFTIGKE